MTSRETTAEMLGIITRLRAEAHRMARTRRECQDLPSAVARAMDDWGTAALGLSLAILRDRHGVPQQ